MSKLGRVVEAVEKYNRFVLDQVKRARTDEKFGRELITRWSEAKAKTPVTHTPTGLPLPRLALPEIDEPGEIARYLFGEGLPGEFPFLNGAYREMYLEPVRENELGSYGRNGDKNEVAAEMSPANRSKVPTRPPRQSGPPEEPTRLFSASMTISGPAPIIMAMYIAAAKSRFGSKVVPKLRGTIQADIFKEVQAQNETIFPIEASLRFLTDMVEFTTRKLPRWYPISIS